jgi:hypothetical protein
MKPPYSFSESDWHNWENTPLPGEIFSTDDQCKDKWGNDSVQCDPNGGGDVNEYLFFSTEMKFYYYY